jgi:hypothetical protein
METTPLRDQEISQAIFDNSLITTMIVTQLWMLSAMPDKLFDSHSLKPSGRTENIRPHTEKTKG